MRRCHEMPFGARALDGGARFRLWAPACRAVGLELGRDSPRRVAMRAEEDGWHSATVEGVAPGGCAVHPPAGRGLRGLDGDVRPRRPSRPVPATRPRSARPLRGQVRHRPAIRQHECRAPQQRQHAQGHDERGDADFGDHQAVDQSD